MPLTQPAPPNDAYTTRITTTQGTVVVHVSRLALLALGAGDDEGSLHRTMRQHMSTLRALALQISHREQTSEVHIRASDVRWVTAQRA